MTAPAAPREPVLRPYRPGDEEAINRAFNAVFGAARPLAEWHWKFPPGAGRRHILAGWADGEVAVHFAAQPVRLQLDGRRLVVGHAVDAFSRRRRGLARRGLFAHAVDTFYSTFCGPAGLPLLYGFPGRRHLLLGHRLLRYADPRPVPVWRCDLAEPRPRPGRWARRLAGVRVDEGFDAGAVDALWRRAAGRYPVAAVRDGARWTARYAGRPGVDYLHLVARRRGVPAAAGVARLEGERLRWADLVWDGRSRAALGALARELGERGRAAGAAEGELWLGGDLAAAAELSALGWRRGVHPQGLELTAVTLVDDLDPGALVRRLYFTLGDSDLV